MKEISFDISTAPASTILPFNIFYYVVQKKDVTVKLFLNLNKVENEAPTDNR